LKIAILGGTGKFGKGLAARWLIRKHEVYIGSRRQEKAELAVKYVKEMLSRYGFYDLKLYPMLNKDAASGAEVIVLTIPYKGLDNIIDLIKDSVKGKVVVSPIVPLKFEDRKPLLISTLSTSVAEYIAHKLDSYIVSALHTIPASKLIELEEDIEGDVVVCGNEENAKKVVMKLVEDIPNLRALDGGSLRNSEIVEKLTYLIVEIGLRIKKPDLTLKFL